MPSRTAIAFVVLLAGLPPFAVGNAERPPARSPQAGRRHRGRAARFTAGRWSSTGTTTCPGSSASTTICRSRRSICGSRRQHLHTDIPRLRKGGVGAQFWSAYVEATQQATRSPNARTDRRRSPHGRDVSRHLRDGLHGRRRGAHPQGRQDRLAHRRRGGPLDRQLARRPAQMYASAFAT